MFWKFCVCRARGKSEKHEQCPNPFIVWEYESNRVFITEFSSYHYLRLPLVGNPVPDQGTIHLTSDDGSEKTLCVASGSSSGRLNLGAGVDVSQYESTRYGTIMLDNATNIDTGEPSLFVYAGGSWVKVANGDNEIYID